MADVEVWTPTTAAAVMHRGGLYVRVSHPDPIEGTVIGGRRVAVNGIPGAVQLALRTITGRAELTLHPDFPVQALLSAPEPAPNGRPGPDQLGEVDALVAALQDLQLVGSDVVRGYQSPAMAAVVDALVAIREGQGGVAARLTP